jgi:hypothetical protein
MKLEHLHYEKCPDCGAEVTGISKRDKHCNGHYNETISFACGAAKVAQLYERGYCLWVQKECPNSPKQKEKEEKRAKAKEKLINYINKLDVDPDFKDNLISRGIQYI